MTIQWCAECLYDLRGRNGRLHRFDSDLDLIEALESGQEVRSVTGVVLSPRAVTMYQGTAVCLPHLRDLWKLPR